MATRQWLFQLRRVTVLLNDWAFGSHWYRFEELSCTADRKESQNDCHSSGFPLIDGNTSLGERLVWNVLTGGGVIGGFSGEVPVLPWKLLTDVPVERGELDCWFSCSVYDVNGMGSWFSCPFCSELDGILIFSGLWDSTCWLGFLLASSIQLSVTETFSTIRLSSSSASSISAPSSSGVSSKTAILSLSSLRVCFFCFNWLTRDLSSAISLWVIVPSVVSSILRLNLVKCALCALLDASSFRIFLS